MSVHDANERPDLVRTKLSNDTRALMESDPESAKYITADMGNREAFALAIKAGLNRGDRTCLRLFAEMARFVGASVHIANQLFLTLGVKDETEIKRALELTRGGQSLSLEDCRSEAVTLLRFVLHERPQWRAEVLRELGARDATDTNGNGAHGG